MPHSTIYAPPPLMWDKWTWLSSTDFPSISYFRTVQIATQLPSSVKTNPFTSHLLLTKTSGSNPYITQLSSNTCLTGQTH